MSSHSVADARNNLSALIDRAVAGEEIVITRHGHPVAEISAPKSRPPLAPKDAEWLRARRVPRRSDGMDAGELRQADPEAAAGFLMGLLKSSIHHRRVWGIDEPLSDRALDAHVAQAVEVFLHGFAILA